METNQNTINVIDMSGDEPKEFTITMPKLPEWSMAKELGYEPKTTFWQDFSIADLYGLNAIHDTLRRAFGEWREDVEYIAELALVLNHKGCFYYAAAEKHDGDKYLYALAQTYFAMYHVVNDYAKEYFTGEDAEYYFRVTD